MDDLSRIRPAVATDIPAIVEIERAVFSDPWPGTAFQELLGDLAWVADHRGELMGYLFARAVAGEAEILNLAVRQDRRRQRLGHRLLSAALAEFQRARVATVYLEVRESNAEGRAFYESQGFREVGRRRSYYQKPREDALVLARRTDPERALA
ncbi:MAG: ribosomal protein S18-alanine N-acetyltransferase [Gemmatimonadetes bacterium]|nr:ribosomal protein S18-alanine N-acetyltransferase [Gemmatimonadota bacterium]